MIELGPRKAPITRLWWALSLRDPGLRRRFLSEMLSRSQECACSLRSMSQGNTISAVSDTLSQSVEPSNQKGSSQAATLDGGELLWGWAGT